jgi:hypothetical protein
MLCVLRLSIDEERALECADEWMSQGFDAVRISDPRAGYLNVTLVDDEEWNPATPGFDIIIRRSKALIMSQRQRGLREAVIDFGIYLRQGMQSVSIEVPAAILSALSEAGLAFEVSCYRSAQAN